MLYILNLLILFYLNISDKELVGNVLDKLHYYASIADGENYFKLFDESSIFFGTDAKERWNKSQFEEYALERFKDGTGWTYKTLSRNIYLSKNKKIAWFDEELGNDKYGVFRGTGVLEKNKGSWYIKQYNLLLPIPNELLIDYSKEIINYLENEN
tara:strand:- start:472 stop:936 length:465 start_codon:yes stop_codon:yes gene_type:complete